ncbi:hypothetical protein N5C72_12995 [Achromobacter mucicolens]|uniref:Uncharacterized protein n=1 Tax=Achromobacter mucicolens TaxID=1389922 RepID=A0ABD4YU56_9BURK|nr:hypothetical protein [Achromobacter mucicolens]MDH1178997.1 hypothetical protein [Achromobacter mucicolens]
MRIPENNRNMLPFPVSAPAYGGAAAALRSGVQAQAGGNDSDVWLRAYPEEKPVPASVSCNELDNRQGFLKLNFS